MGLFGEVMESSEAGALVEEVRPPGVGIQFLQLCPIFCSLSASCVHMQCNQVQLPAPAAAPSPP